MNRKIFLPLAAGIAGIAVLGCGSSGPSASGYVPKKPASLPSATVAAGQEATYFPFAVGSQWTYDSQTSRSVNGHADTPKKQEITYRLDKLTKSPNGGQDATFTILTNGEINDQEVWRVESTGIYQVAMGRVRLNPLSTPQPMLPFPVKAGQTFSWSGSITADKDGVRQSTSKGTILGEQPIDTVTSQYNAIAVDTTGTLKGKSSDMLTHSILWFIPNVGIGRFKMEIAGNVDAPAAKGKKVTVDMVQVLELKNYSPKK